MEPWEDELLWDDDFSDEEEVAEEQIEETGLKMDEDSFADWEDASDGAPVDETLEEALAEERTLELESELEQDEHPRDHSCRSGTDSPLLYSGIPETGRVPEDYADGGEDLFQPCREQELFLRQPQCLSFHDGRGPDGKNRLYGEGRLLLCGGAERWRTYFRHCPSGLRLAEQQDL